MPQALNPELINLFYDAASIRRWNDQINPMDFTELDKQAHKMIIAYVLAKFSNQNESNTINWLRLIEGGMFEMLHRIVLTDIKPPVFHRMMSEKGPELNQWVVEKLQPHLKEVGTGFQERLCQHFFDRDYAAAEKRILKAAHYLATQWEFNILYQLCPFINGIETIRQEIENQIEDHYDLLGVQKISLKRKTAGFVDLCGQLRFQKRWSQSPRIPATSVLGHMLLVAILTYLSLRLAGASDARLVNSFMAALFHDLPEVLTRDITSPIKAAVEGLDDIIKEYERRQMEDRLLPLLPSAWHNEIRYYTENEFDNRVIIDGKVEKITSFEEMGEKFDTPEYCPIDGEVIRCCDHLAALIEAALSFQHGVRSKHLADGANRLQEMYQDKIVGNIDFGQTFACFKR